MTDALAVFVPFVLFMLIPLWIPFIALTVGVVVERVVPSRPSPAAQAVENARVRTAAARASAPATLAEVRTLPTHVDADVAA